MLQAIVVASAVIWKLVEVARNAIGSHILDGWKVNLVAFGLALFVCFGFGLSAFSTLLADYGVAPADWADKIMTAAGIAAGSGFFADWTGRSGNTGEVILHG